MDLSKALNAISYDLLIANFTLMVLIKAVSNSLLVI